MRIGWLAPLLWIGAVQGATVPEPDLALAEQDYQRHCQQCHGVNRIGAAGPALLPQSLSRIKPDEIRQVIANGRPASQMAAFGTVLAPAQIDGLTHYLQRPPAVEPTWSEDDTRRSHRLLADVVALPDKPQHHADPLNLFVVVEAGDHHVDIVDGDRFEVLARFASHFALHGGPKFSPDGRFVYFASRDGWISLYDLHNLTLIAEVRAGLNTRNLAVSKDGRWVLVGNTLPGNVVVLDARDLSLVKTVATVGLNGQASRVSAVYTAPPRDSFIVALKDVKEVWELSTGPNPDFVPRRIEAEDYLDDFSFSPDYRQLLATSRKAQGGQVIDLDTGRIVSDIALPGMPHLGSGTYWKRDGHWVFATPNISKGLISVIDFDTWKVIQQIPHPGAGFLPAQPCQLPLRLDRCVLRPRQRCHSPDRQTDPGNRPHPAAHARQDRRPRRVHPRRPLLAAEYLGHRWRADRLRQRHPQGNQAPAHEQAFGQVQRRQQDRVCRGDVPLKKRGLMRSPQ